MGIIEIFKEFIFQQDLTSVLLILTLLFGTLYFGISTFFQLGVNILLKRGLASKIILAKKFQDQIKHEIIYSLFSIIVFASYGFLIILLIRNQVLDVHFKVNYSIFTDLLILIIWNEFHFYVCHRIMHTKPLIRFHSVHHKSRVVTPFSTYSFHPLESVLNGTVLIIPMFFHTFGVLALFLFPVYHLVFNTIGHTNIKIEWNNFFNKFIKVSSRHNLHHTKFHVSYGFATPYMDYLFTKKNKIRNDK